MIKRLIYIVVFIVAFSLFVKSTFLFENEKSNAYYTYNGDVYSLVALDTDELYIYGITLEDSLTLTNGDTYTTFGEVKDNQEVAMQYLSYTFGIKDLRYLDPANPDYGSKFANYLVDQTKGEFDEFSATLEDLPSSYESKYNVEYLRLAKLADYNSEGYMDKNILTSIVNGEDDEDVNTETKEVTEEMVKQVFVNIQTIPLTCDDTYCTLDEEQMSLVTSTFKKLLNQDVIYISNFDGQEKLNAN